MQIADAAKYGNLNIPSVQKMLRLLRNKSKPSTGNDIRKAASFGDLDTVKYLFENGAPIDSHAIEGAAGYGYLNVVKYLFENKAPIDEYAIAGGAYNGRMHIVKYLFENKAPINRYVIECAIQTGQLNIVKYLFENGAPIDIKNAIKVAETANVCEVSKKFEYPKILDYLVFMGDPPRETLKTLIFYKRYQNIYRELLTNFIIDDISLIIVSYLI